jgi:hypothetical protein
MHRGTRTVPFSLIAIALVACSSNSSGPTAGFECLGQPLPTTAPATVSVSGRITQNFTSPTALRGAYVVAFRTGDTTKLATDSSKTNGLYSVSITTGGTPVDGYIRVTDSTRHLPTYAYPPVPLAASETTDVFMPTASEFSFLAAAAGITPVNGDGFIGVLVKDCSGAAIVGATVASTPAGTVRYNAGGVPSSSATATDSTGVAYIANVSAGNVTVQATASGHTLRQHVVNARANAITLTQIKP